MKGLKLYFSILVYVACSCNTGTLPVYFENKKTIPVKIDVLIPAKSDIPPGIQSLGLVSSLPSEAFIKFILTDYKFCETEITSTYLDTVLTGVFDGMFEKFINSTNVDFIHVPENIVESMVSNWKFVDSICSQYDVDGLIYLKNIQIRLDEVLPKNLKELDNIPFLFSFDGSLKSEATIFAAILLPDDKTNYTVGYQAKDELSVAVDYISSDSVFFNIDFAQTIGYVSYVAGKSFVKYLAPTWETISRKYYGSAHSLLRLASKYVTQNDWESAAKIWDDNRKSNNAVLAKHCQFNLILAKEVQGDIDEALRMISAYNRTYNEPIANEYQKELEKRKKLIEKLEEQL